MSERAKLINERLANLKRLRSEEVKSRNKSIKYISDLDESIRYCEKELASFPTDYEMVKVMIFCLES